MARFVTLVNNLWVFLILSVINTIVSIKLPISLFHYNSWLFKERKWENNGHIYQCLLAVKKWKNILPELSDFIKFLFSKKQILQYNSDYLFRFALETCRAELAHWCIIASSFLFTLWNSIGMSAFMIFLAAALNLPYIIIQRYNRPRVLNILANKKLPINHNLEVLHYRS